MKLLFLLFFLCTLPNAHSARMPNGNIILSDLADGVCRIASQHITHLPSKAAPLYIQHSTTGFLIQPPAEKKFDRYQSRLVLTVAHAFQSRISSFNSVFVPQASDVTFSSSKQFLSRKIEKWEVHPNFMNSKNHVDQALILLSIPAVGEEETEIFTQNYAALKHHINKFSATLEKDQESLITEDANFVSFGRTDQNTSYRKTKFPAKVINSKTFRPDILGKECEIIGENTVYTYGYQKAPINYTFFPKEADSNFLSLPGDCGGKLSFGPYTAIHFMTVINEVRPKGVLAERTENNLVASWQENYYQLIDLDWIKQTLEQWRN